MTLLGKHTPGSAPGFEWAEDTDVHDVPRDLASDLLDIPDADFFEVTEPDPDAHTLPTKKADLIALAEHLGIDSSGTVKDLTDRITAHQADTDNPPGEPETPGDESEQNKTPVTEPDPDAHTA